MRDLAIIAAVVVVFLAGTVFGIALAVAWADTV